ncbi:MAG: hypothetical protein ACMXX5_02210 [Candidatus Woesearchaeota archaeon]
MWKYFTHGLFLLGMGLIPFLYNYNIIEANLTDTGLFQYLVIAWGLLAGRELVTEGIKEHNKIMKFSSIMLGIALVAITSIPSLYQLNAITFTIGIPDIALYILYIISGFMLAMGSFVFAREKD